MRPGKPSLTATWVAIWRGAASYVHPSIVSDPVAETLLPRRYRWIVSAARRSPAGTTALHAAIGRLSGWRSHHMMLRTRAIDDAIVAAVQAKDITRSSQLVIIGAGLDARAWRLDELRDCAVFEVDHPATQA